MRFQLILILDVACKGKSVQPAGTFDDLAACEAAGEVMKSRLGPPPKQVIFHDGEIVSVGYHCAAQASEQVRVGP